MAESARDRKKRYDAYGRAMWTFGPLTATLVNAGLWLFSVVTGDGYVGLGAVAFYSISVGLAALWAHSRLRHNARGPDA